MVQNVVCTCLAYKQGPVPVHPSLNSHIPFSSIMAYLSSTVLQYITDIKINGGRLASRPFIILINLKFFRAYRSLKPHILLYSNGLAIWHRFPDITHIKVINRLKLSIFEFDQVDISQGISLSETTNLFYSNGLAICFSFPIYYSY